MKKEKMCWTCEYDHMKSNVLKLSEVKYYFKKNIFTRSISAWEMGWEARIICGAGTPLGNVIFHCLLRLAPESTIFTLLLKYKICKVKIEEKNRDSKLLLVQIHFWFFSFHGISNIFLDGHTFTSNGVRSSVFLID